MLKKIIKIYPGLLVLLFVLALLVSIFSLGNYWDWMFPYFRSGLNNIFSERYAWIPANLGSPLGYSSVFYFGWFLLLIKSILFFASNEVLQLIIVGSVLIASGVLAYRLLDRPEKNKLQLLLLSAVVVFNPAIFYKLFAGHVAYLYSYAILISLITFLLYGMRRKPLHYIMLGLFLGFVGFQVQFFVFTAIILCLYFLFAGRQYFKLGYLWLTLIVALLINLPWLSNFLAGANAVSTVSQGAGRAAFSGAMFANPQRILSLTFSSATGIQYVYPKPALALFGLFSLLTIVSLLYYLFVVRRRGGNTEDVNFRERDGRILFVSFCCFHPSCFFPSFKVFPFHFFSPFCYLLLFSQWLYSK